jgi:hypothetical protein
MDPEKDLETTTYSETKNGDKYEDECFMFSNFQNKR